MPLAAVPLAVEQDEAEGPGDVAIAWIGPAEAGQGDLAEPIEEARRRGRGRRLGGPTGPGSLSKEGEGGGWVRVLPDRMTGEKAKRWGDEQLLDKASAT
jgi:hypothetical protein